MKVYLIVEVDAYCYQIVTGLCFINKERAEEYCHNLNKDTYNYLQNCADNYEETGNYILYEVVEVEVIKDDN